MNHLLLSQYFHLISYKNDSARESLDIYNSLRAFLDKFIELHVELRTFFTYSTPLTHWFQPLRIGPMEVKYLYIALQ